jgi:hypothetical protein
MEPQDVFQMAENPNFISGIYNYCDRWCERCPFTSRCMTFAMEEQRKRRRGVDSQAYNTDHEEFWEEFSETLQLAFKMLAQIAEERGLDLDSVDVEEEMKEQRRDQQRAGKHDSARTSKVYTEMVQQWFDSCKELFEEKEDELNMKVRLAVADTAREAAAIQEAVKVIQWYNFQIHVKLMRALQGRRQEQRDMELCGEFSKDKDSDGSAKVALIGIDRSMAAWATLHKHFPEEEDSILKFLVHLERLRRHSEKEFPNARAFVRPGFDTIELYLSPDA